MTGLPSLTDEPTRHPGCCVSLSVPLLDTIKTLLQSIPIIAQSVNTTTNEESLQGCNSAPPQSALILSIGSGTGLLEELLHDYLNHGSHNSLSAPNHPNFIGNWRVEGVEVNQAVNVHLPEDRISRVAGTWAVHESRARDATALMFVYPRDGALVRRYIDEFMGLTLNRARIGENEQGGREKDEFMNENTYESEGKHANEVIRRGENRGQDNLETCGTSRGDVQLVLWLGPKCDWGDTDVGSLGGSHEFEVLDLQSGVGLAEYEILAAVRRKTTTPNSMQR
ncbi:hypothetical protein GQX73_g1615 [Xylaria multiplex]|uniref:Uncharacterized protein n=1 Tax=Xylaria multiplex TaxID=323545 RepID=A0A7C8MUU9_9PEZI|nr:hypothetical protein GQX73_g1615 [Xylaria multiplex]